MKAVQEVLPKPQLMTHSQYRTAPTFRDVPAHSTTGSLPQRSRYKAAPTSMGVPSASAFAEELPPTTCSIGDLAAVLETRAKPRSGAVSSTKRRRAATINLSEKLQQSTVLESSKRTCMGLSATSHPTFPTAPAQPLSRSHDLSHDGNWSLPNETILKADGSRSPNCEDGKHYFDGKFLSKRVMSLSASSTQARTISGAEALPISYEVEYSNTNAKPNSIAESGRMTNNNDQMELAINPLTLTNALSQLATRPTALGIHTTDGGLVKIMSVDKLSSVGLNISGLTPDSERLISFCGSL
jgi:hypothetical protein